jgi:hypothetical protein
VTAMKTKLILSFLFIILCITSCNSVEPPSGLSIELKLEDKSCTEIWLTLSTNLKRPVAIDLKQNNNVVKTINLIKADTLVYINSLLPNTAYTFQAFIEANRVTSNTVNVTTLDTTIQNFSFEFFEFGDGFSSSYFNDVWIFNENDIWVCGNVFTNDSMGGNLYNWNGSYWKAHRLNFVDMEGIWGINNIMYLASGGIWKYDRVNLIRQNIEGTFSQGQAVHKLWGSSESNIYGVGPWGTVVWYNGVKWTKIEFDTQWYFYEITGNKETGVAYAVAISPSNQYDALVVKLENLIVSNIYRKSEAEIKIESRTITYLDNYLYLVGSDLQSTKICRLTEGGEIEILQEISSFIGIGQSSALIKNDIYYAGGEGSEVRLVHFNGIGYKIFNIPQIDSDNYGGIHAIKDLAVSVGFTNNKAYIIKIRR